MSAGHGLVDEHFGRFAKGWELFDPGEEVRSPEDRDALLGQFVLD